MQTTLTAAAALITDVDTIVGRRIEIDEHRLRRVRYFRLPSGAWRRHEPWMSTIADLDTGRVLGVVDGRSNTGVGAWLAARPRCVAGADRGRGHRPVRGVRESHPHQPGERRQPRARVRLPHLCTHRTSPAVTASGHRMVQSKWCRVTRRGALQHVEDEGFTDEAGHDSAARADRMAAFQPIVDGRQPGLRPDTPSSWSKVGASSGAGTGSAKALPGPW